MNAITNQQSTAFSIGGTNRFSGIFSGQYKTDGNFATAGAFAADIVNRISRPTGSWAGSGFGDSNSVGETSYQELAKTAPKTQKDLDGLRTSLENTINAIASRHGSQTANSVMDIVYQNVGGEVNESNLGQGFLKAISFIDRNFGIDQGNKLMGELNEGLNEEMNSYFDNGAKEVFFDATSTPSAALRTAKGIMKQTEGLFDEVANNSENGELELAGAMSPEDLEKMLLEAKAKRMLAKGEIPPAYLQEYLPSGAMPAAVSGTMLNTAV